MRDLLKVDVPGFVAVDYVLKRPAGPGTRSLIEHLRLYGVRSARAVATKAPGIAAVCVREEDANEARHALRAVNGDGDGGYVNDDDDCYCDACCEERDE